MPSSPKLGEFVGVATVLGRITGFVSNVSRRDMILTEEHSHKTLSLSVVDEISVCTPKGVYAVPIKDWKWTPKVGGWVGQASDAPVVH